MTSPISEAARLMGQARTPAKAQAARRNGAKGGRPRKHKTDPALLPGCGCVQAPARPLIVAVLPKDGGQ